MAGDDRNRQIGPRAMAPEEFKAWFIKKMKAKERKMINELVSARVRTLPNSALGSWQAFCPV